LPALCTTRKENQTQAIATQVRSIAPVKQKHQLHRHRGRINSSYEVVEPALLSEHTVTYQGSYGIALNLPVQLELVGLCLCRIIPTILLWFSPSATQKSGITPTLN
ncbi:hypothetical protein L915_08674, partial [Phytophthora nicotianae]